MTDLEFEEQLYLQQEAFDIVYAYVTHGEIHGSDLLKHFDDSFDEFVKISQKIDILPVKKSKIVYRTLFLNDQQLKKLIRNKLILNHRKYMSWTSSIKSAENIAWKQKHRGNVIIIKYLAKPSEIVIDVKGFYIKNQRTNDDTYWKYVEHENEIILKHDGPLVLTKDNTIIFDFKTIIPPKITDKVRDFDEVLTIEHIDYGYQPYEKYGIYLVTINSPYYEGEFKIRPVMKNNIQVPNKWILITDD